MSRTVLRITYLVAFLGMAVGYYYFLGAAPTPSEMPQEIAWWRPRGLALELESDWLAPLQAIAADVEQARHEGRSEPRGAIPLGVFALPAIRATAIGFALFRSPLPRVGLLTVGLTLCAFSYYGWLDPQTWHDYGWRWPAVLVSTSFYISLFALHGGVGHLRQIGVFEAKVLDSLPHFGIQQRIAAASLKFRQNPCAVQGYRFRAAQFPENTEQAKRNNSLPLARCNPAETSWKPKRNPTT